MFAIVLGQLAGLARSIIIARTFGDSPELDAFFAANHVNEMLFLLLAGGALGSAFIPTFTGLLAKNETTHIFPWVVTEKLEKDSRLTSARDAGRAWAPGRAG